MHDGGLTGLAVVVVAGVDRMGEDEENWSSSYREVALEDDERLRLVLKVVVDGENG